jgi:hypothetical protein
MRQEAIEIGQWGMMRVVVVGCEREERSRSALKVDNRRRKGSFRTVKLIKSRVENSHGSSLRPHLNPYYSLET